MFRYQPFVDPLAVLVGATMMAPPAMVPGVPAGNGCGIPSQCPPLGYCPPQSPAFYQNASNAAQAAGAPQATLGVNSFDQSPNTEITNATSRTLTARPTLPMCITRFIADRNISAFFQLSSIKVSKTEYLSDGQSVPADGYTSDTTTPPLRLPMLFTGTDISLTVFNKAAEPHHFWGEYRGFDGPGCYPCLG